MRAKACFVFFFATLALLLSLPLAGAAGDRQFTVVFKSSTLPDNAAAIVQSAGARIISAIPQVGMMKIEGPVGLLDSLGAMPAIEAISPSIEFKLPPEPHAEIDFGASFDTSGAFFYNLYQWDIKQVTNNGASFDLWSGTHQTVVAVLDTGINTQHEALVANLLGGRNFVPNSSDGIVDPDNFEDQHGHGSHCASAVAGNGLILGVGPNLGIRAYRVLDEKGSGASDWIIGGIIAAADDGVDVISMSIGGYDPIAGITWTDPETGKRIKMKYIADLLAWKRAVQYAVSKGVIVTMAAANDAVNISNPKAITNMFNELLGQYGYEILGATKEIGTIPGVLTISATGPDLSPASYTNYGPGAIDLSAPGGDYQRIEQDSDWYLDMCLGAYIGGPYYYSFMAGTSMATPKVAAVAALIIDYAKSMGEPLKPVQVISRLQQGSLDLGKIGYDMYYGYGTVNVVSALTRK